MIKTLTDKIPELSFMKSYPKELFYIGDTQLLKRTKVSIVGSRSPNQYAKQMTHLLASRLAEVGVCVVSGGALGVDAIAHKAVGASNTIMVAATGLDKRYPAVNRNIIQDIENEGLVLSQFKEKTPSQRYNFPIRNEVVVALGDVMVVTYADLDSGSMRSIEFAMKMNKEIFVLPHRIGESMGTNELLANGQAKAIYDIDSFIKRFGSVHNNKQDDEFLQYFRTNPSYEDAIQKYGDVIFEYEFNAKISVTNGYITVL